MSTPGGGRPAAATPMSPAMQAQLRRRRAATRHAVVMGSTVLATALTGLVASGAALGWWGLPFVSDPDLADPTVAGVSTTASALVCSADGTLPVADPTTVTVSVLNGTDTAGLAGTTGEALAARGFVIGTVGNTTATADTLSVIRYPAGQEAQAAAVALHSGITTTAVDSGVSTVTLVLGTDFSAVLTVEDAAARLAGGEVIPGCRAAVAG